MAGVCHQVQHGAFHDQVIKVASEQLLHADPRNELGARILLRVLGVEAILVLDEDHLARTECLGNQVAAGVGPLWRDAPDFGVLFPQLIRWHALTDHRPALHQIVRHGGEAFGFKKGDAMRS